MDNLKVWKPLGEGSESRIVADPAGTALERTVTIHAACEMLPDEALAFARQIEEAVAWLREGGWHGLFVKGAWIADPNVLSDGEFYQHFCCGHGGLAHDFKQRLIWCQYTGKKLADFGGCDPIPIPAWCPKRGGVR